MQSRAGGRQQEKNLTLRTALRWLPCFLLLLYLALALAPDGEAPRFSDRDGSQHFIYALNLAERGVFSLGRKPGPIEPDAIRTPGYPMVLALALKGGEVGECPDVRHFLWRKGRCRSVHTRLLYLNFTLFLTLVAAVYGVALRLSGTVLLAFAAAALVAFEFAPLAFAYRSEVLTGLLLLAHAEGLRRAYLGTLSTWQAVVTGLLGGWLVLTTPAFVVWWLLLALTWLLLLGLPVIRRRPPRPAWKVVSAILMPMTLVVCGWMTRNLFQVGHFALSGRGGSVMAVRAEYDAMSWADYRAAWKLWPDARYLGFWVDREAALASAPLLQRGREGSYYERSRHLFLPLYFSALAERSVGRLGKSRSVNHETSAVAAQLPTEEGLDDAKLRQAALAAMMENWPMHLALTPLLAVRGAGLQAPMLLLVALVLCWRRRAGPSHGAMLVFVAPIAASIAFHAALTHFIPRYGLPLLPLTAAATVWALAELYGRLRARRAAAPLSPSSST